MITTHTCVNVNGAMYPCYTVSKSLWTCCLTPSRINYSESNIRGQKQDSGIVETQRCLLSISTASMKEITPQLALVHPCFFWLLSLPLDYFEWGCDLSTKLGAVWRLICCTKAAWNKRAALASREISPILCINVLILPTYSRADAHAQEAAAILVFHTF